MTAITVDPQNLFYSSVGGVLFDKDQSTLLEYPAGRVGSYLAPSGLADIGPDAFYGCDRLTSITLPYGVTNIETEAFADCLSLTGITIPAGVSAINDDTFNNCSSLTNVTIPQGVASIGDYAFFGCASLPDLAIPDTVTNIGQYAFEGCAGLVNVTIPNSVATLGYDPFAGCSNLVSVTLSSNVTSLGDGTFLGCPNLTAVFYNGNAPAITGLPLFDDSSTVTNYFLPDTTGWYYWYSTGLQLAPWLPTMQPHTTDAGFGGQTNPFGFNITWASGQTVVVEASTNLIDWGPVQTNTLTTGSAYFSDSEWTNYPGRFYRLRSP
jgi:hypothetical protein